jgi:hypothetical protein
VARGARGLDRRRLHHFRKHEPHGYVSSGKGLGRDVSLGAPASRADGRAPG